MTNPKYKSQYQEAEETLTILKATKAQIEFNLENDSITVLHKELRTVNQDYF
jgi:hypothetical protein